MLYPPRERTARSPPILTANIAADVGNARTRIYLPPSQGCQDSGRIDNRTGDDTTQSPQIWGLLRVMMWVVASRTRILCSEPLRMAALVNSAASTTTLCLFVTLVPSPRVGVPGADGAESRL